MKGDQILMSQKQLQRFWVMGLVEKMGSDFAILLLRPWTAFFSNQLYDKVPREVNSWLPRHNGRLPKKGRLVNT